jgi:glycosyltransferase involved in cell wall biosynthesis
MRIAHVTQGYWPGRGGTELVIQRVSEELVARHQCAVAVYTTNCLNGEGFFDPAQTTLPVGATTHQGVSIHRFAVRSRAGAAWRRIQAPFWRLRLPGHEFVRSRASGPIAPDLRAALRTVDADVFAASSFPLLHMFDTAREARRRGQWPVLIGGLHPEDRWGFDRRRIYDAIRDSLYIAYSQFEADVVMARGADASRVFVVGAGVDPEPFAGADGRAMRVAVGLDPDRPVVGYVGQLGGHKGIDVLVRAMRQVWARQPGTQLLIAGARSHFLPVIEAQIADLPPSMRGQVRLVLDFPDEDKAGLFAATDVFTYPSGYESFGIAFVEAWAAGKPVIGCRRGAVPTVVTDTVDGLLTTWQDDDDLAAAIVTLLRAPDQARAMGEAGRRKMHLRYRWPHVADRFHDVYRLAAG